MNDTLRKTAIVSAVIAGSLLLLNAGCSSLERKLLFFPTHHDDSNGLKPWMVDGSLVGYVRDVAQSKNVWLMLHGNGGQATDRVYAFQHFAADDLVYVLEYPGYGNRKGTPSKDAFNMAAQAAYMELRKQFPLHPVCVVAESIGSGAASYLATLSTPPDKIVLIVPFDRLKFVAQEHFPSWLVSLLLRDDWNNVELLSHYHGPVDIYGAENDSVIPVAHAKALAASIPQARFTLIAGGHNDWSQDDKVKIRYE